MTNRASTTATRGDQRRQASVFGYGERSLAALHLDPRAVIVTEMTPVEWRGFLADVTERGLIDPLHILKDGTILDGRHRYRAAHTLGLDRVPVRVVDPPDPVEYMLRSALCRRQLTKSQRAALAVKLDQHTKARVAGLARRRANLRHADSETLPDRDAATLGELATSIAGVSDRTLRDAAYVHQHDPDVFARVESGALAVGVAANRIRARRRDAGLDAPPLPQGQFDLLLADPPWQSKTPDTDWAPERHYPTMPVEEICALNIPTAKDAILFLWAIAGQRRDADTVIDAWGFTPRDEIIWVKDGPAGLGAYTRHQHEILFVATKGSYPPPSTGNRLGSVITAPRGRHSQKPDEFYEAIEHMYPGAKRRLELFARSARPSWTAWGNQTPLADQEDEAA